MSEWTVGDEVALFALAEGIPLEPWQMEYLARALPEPAPSSG